MADNCRLPEDVYYWPEKHVWARPNSDGTVTVGLTDVAQALAGKLVAVSPKGTGKTLAKGKSAGTAESGKWVGAVPAPVSGEIVTDNPAVKTDPGLVNTDPYGEGWIVRLKPADWEGEKVALVTGAVGVGTYREFLVAQGISCGTK